MSRVLPLAHARLHTKAHCAHAHSAHTHTARACRGHRRPAAPGNEHIRQINGHAFWFFLWSACGSAARSLDRGLYPSSLSLCMCANVRSLRAARAARARDIADLLANGCRCRLRCRCCGGGPWKCKRSSSGARTSHSPRALTIRRIRASERASGPASILCDRVCARVFQLLYASICCDG